MKDLKNITTTALLIVILMVSTMSGALAQDVITIENGEITILSDDGENVVMIDAEALESFIESTLDEAMTGMHDVIEELDDMQLEIRLGDDNQLSFETEDQMWEMNLDVIMNEVTSALSLAFDEMDTEGWGGHRHHMGQDIDEEDLADELDRLKDELHRLQRELDSLKEI